MIPSYVQDLVDRKVGAGWIPFADEEEFPASFPYARWNVQLQRYHEYWRHWTGERWQEPVPNLKDENGNPVLRYPLQINKLATIAKKHAAAVIGEVSDNSPTAIPARIRPKPNPANEEYDESALKEAKTLEYFINDVWDDNGGKALQSEAVLLSQFLGGIVLKVGWQPDDLDLEYGIRLEIVLPDFFMPVWDTGKPHELLEAWVVWRVPAREAYLKYGFNLKEGVRDPLYIEHWTRDEINITIGGNPVEYIVNGVRFRYDHVPNPFGFVPFVYIPRKRAGGYFGISLVEDIKGLEEELNGRLADLGDIVNDVAQRDLVAVDLPNRSITTIDLGKGRKALYLGTTAPGMEKPTLTAVDPPKLPEGLSDLPTRIEKEIEHQASTPAITYGEDQGSQRSGQTLNVRFWSLTSEAQSQRYNWDVAMKRLNKMICKIAVVKGVGGISEKMMQGKHWRNAWSPMLPKDREQLLNEGVLLSSQQAVHPATIAEKLEWVEDPLEEYERAMEHYERVAKLQSDMKMQEQEQMAKIKQPQASAGAAGKS